MSEAETPKRPPPTPTAPAEGEQPPRRAIIIGGSPAPTPAKPPVEIDDSDDLAIRPPSRSIIQKAANEEYRREQSEYEEYVTSIDFADSSHTISLSRLEPEWDPKTRQSISGFLARYSHALTLEEIQQRYGGGRYEVRITGPHPETKQKVLKAKKVFRIAGNPIVESEEDAKAAAAAEAAKSQNDLVKTLLAQKEKEIERLAEEQKNMSSLVLQTIAKQESGMKEVLAAALSPGKNAEQLREEREERRRAEEAAERRHREDQEARRREHQEALAAQQRQHELAMKQLELQTQRDREDAKTRAEQMERQFKMQMEADQRRHEAALKQMELAHQAAIAALKNGESEKASQQQTMWQMLTTMQQQARESEQRMTQLMIEQLTKKKEPDLIEQVTKLKALKEVFDGGSEDNTPGWERALDKIGEIVPGVLAARGVMSAAGATPNPGTPPARVIKRGTVAVVEEDEAPRRRRRIEGRKRSEAAPATSVAPSPPAPAAEQPQQEAGAPPAENPLKEFTFPDGSEDLDKQGELLLANVDLALQKGLSASEVVEQVLKKFPKGFMALLKSVPVDMFIDGVEERVPASWAINGLAGKRLMRELHAHLMVL